MTQDIVLRQDSGMIDIGKFGMSKIGLTVTGEVTFEDCQKCFNLLEKMDGLVQWNIGDLLLIWQKWGDKYQKAIEETGLDYETLKKYKHVSDRIQLGIRIPNLSWSHHEVVSKFEPAEQKYWLNLAEKKNISVRELKQAIKDARNDSKRAQPFPTGKYQVVYADPPWQYDNSGFDQSAEAHYPTMPTDEICALSVESLCTDESVLFLWATNPLLEDAIKVLHAWGFDYKTNIVWIKDRTPGLGWFLKSKHELLLIGTRENTPHPIERPDSCFEAERGIIHSKKPDCVYAMIESMYPGEKIELFARQAHDQWAAWGNEELGKCQ